MAFAYSVMKERNVDNVSPNRILKLIPLDGGAVISVKRNTFNLNAFKGDKNLHAIQDAGLWRLEYRSADGSGAGALPEPLKQQWTSFNQLMKFLVPYFESRNVKVEEITNAPAT